MKLIEYPDREMMMMTLADQLASELKLALTTHDQVTFSVPGGTTPGPVFDLLSSIHLDWSRVSIVLNDERWVDTSSPRSNTRLLHERLLIGQAAEAHLLPIYLPGDRPEDRLSEISEGLTPHLPISVLLLGMGLDMHTASLFPGADNLARALAEDAPPVMAMRASGAGEPRITLTAPVLRDAMTTHVLIMGSEKRAALEKAQKLSAEEAPIKCVLGDAVVHWAE